MTDDDIERFARTVKADGYRTVMIDPLAAKLEHTMTDDERLETTIDALQQIAQWADAYPIDIFPEPEWHKGAELLQAGGMTLDAISAHCMRHVILGVGKIAREALGTLYARDLLHIGNRVEKKRGYQWPGIVIMSGLTLAGERRVVVECTVSEVSGALHVYDPQQLRVVRESRP